MEALKEMCGEEILGTLQSRLTVATFTRLREGKRDGCLSTCRVTSFQVCARLNFRCRGLR